MKDISGIDENGKPKKWTRRKLSSSGIISIYQLFSVELKFPNYVNFEPIVYVKRKLFYVSLRCVCN